MIDALYVGGSRVQKVQKMKVYVVNVTTLVFALHARMSLQTGVGCVGSASLKRVLHTTYKALWDSSTVLECMTPWTTCSHVETIQFKKWRTKECKT